MSLKYKLLTLLTFSLLTFSFNTQAMGTSPGLSLYPSEGSVERGEDFVVDALVDTKGEDVVLVRAVLNFDPEFLEVKDAQRNEDTMCDWPEAEQLVDNNEGLVMATGFCQSGGEEGTYATTGEADIFVRLTFATLKEGSTTLQWEYSGFDEPESSVIMTDGSPPQNILELDEGSLEYTYNITLEEEPKMPETGIPVFENISSTFVLGGSVFLLALVTNVLLDPKRRYFRKSRTIVVYDDEEK